MEALSKIASKSAAQVDHPILDLISRRWSPRAFAPDPPSAEDLQRLFEAMRWAPSSMNEQPWRVIYGFRGEKTHQLIAETLKESNRIWAAKAPVLLLTLVKKYFSASTALNPVAHHDLGLAIGNLTIQATSMGLGLHQMAGFSRIKAINLFSIPEDFEPVTAIALGYYGDPESLPGPLKEKERSVRTRHPIKDFAFHGKFGNHENNNT